MLSFELLLIIGVLGFYLYDSSMLLYINELVFIRGYRAWNFSCPSTNWLVLGRRLYIPNPLSPNMPIFRLNWAESNHRSKSDITSLEEVLAVLVPVQYLLATLLACFFIVLPLVLLLYGSGPQLLWAFGVIYLNIFLILILVYLKKDVLGVSNREYLALSFESLACAPFALNILRKLTLRRLLSSDPMEFANTILDREKFEVLVDVVNKRIDEQIESVDIDNPRSVSLQLYKTKISGMKQ